MARIEPGSADWNILNDMVGREGGENVTDAIERIVEQWEGDSCARCGSTLNDDGTCTDKTCPFSDCQQSDKAGWAGHPEQDKEC